MDASGEMCRHKQEFCGQRWVSSDTIKPQKTHMYLCVLTICTCTAFSLFSSSDEDKRDEAQRKEDDIVLLLKKAKVPEARLEQKQGLLYSAKTACRGTGLGWSCCGIITVMLECFVTDTDVFNDFACTQLSMHRGQLQAASSFLHQAIALAHQTHNTQAIIYTYSLVSCHLSRQQLSCSFLM